MFSLLVRIGENMCCRCGDTIVDADGLTIDHVKPWLHISNDLFWDLGNIAFAHRACNSRHIRRPLRRSALAPKGTAWCSGHQEFLPVNHFTRSAGNRVNGYDFKCIQCKKDARARRGDTAKAKNSRHLKRTEQFVKELFGEG